MVSGGTLAALAIIGLVFGGLVGGLVLLFRSVTADAEWPSPTRRRIANWTFYPAAGMTWLAFWGLGSSFVVDIDTVAGIDTLLAGVGVIVVAAVPLTVGLMLAFEAADAHF